MGILTLVGRVILLTLLHSLFYQRTMHAEAHGSPTEDKMISHSITVESEEMTSEPQEITLGNQKDESSHSPEDHDSLNDFSAEKDRDEKEAATRCLPFNGSWNCCLICTILFLVIAFGCGYFGHGLFTSEVLSEAEKNLLKNYKGCQEVLHSPALCC